MAIGFFTLIARNFLDPLTRKRNKMNRERKYRLYGWKSYFFINFGFKGDRELFTKRFIPPKNIWDFIGFIFLLIGAGFIFFQE